MSRKKCLNCVFRHGCSRSVVVEGQDEMFNTNRIIIIRFGKRGKIVRKALISCSAHELDPSMAPKKRVPKMKPAPESTTPEQKPAPESTAPEQKPAPESTILEQKPAPESTKPEQKQAPIKKKPEQKTAPMKK